MKQRKRVLALLLAGCMISGGMTSFESNAKESDSVVIDVTEYGVTPDSGLDSALGIKAALDEAKKLSDAGKSVVLDFPTGRYDIYPDQVEERELYISNTVGAKPEHKNKKIGILLENMDNVTVDGNNSLFMFHGKMTTVAAIDCENVRFEEFQVDFQTPTVVDITVESVDGNSAVVYVPECYNYSVEGNTVRWISDSSPYTGQPYWTDTNKMDYTQRFDTTTGLTYRGETRNNPVFDGATSIQDLGNHRIQFTYDKRGDEVRPGMCFQIRRTVRDHAGMFFWKSKDVVLENLDVHFLHGFGMVGQSSENLTLHDVDLEAPEESGRTTAGYADFLQVSGCKGKVEISDCTFSNPHDDPINVHGTFLQVTQILADNKIKVTYQHHETAGFPNFFEGDQIEFMTKGDMIPVKDSVATVTKVDGPDGKGGNMGDGSGSLRDIILTLDKPIPDSVKVNEHVVENITYTPEVFIHNNVFKETPTRGILVTTRKPIVIENNTFDGMGMAGIYISNDAQSWYESGPTSDVTIRNNTFTRGKAQAIYVDPTNPNVSTTQTVHSNMKIEGNTFYLENQSVLDAKSVKDLIFKNNKIYRQDSSVTLTASAEKTQLAVGESEKITVETKGTEQAKNLYKFNGCKNVVLENNSYDGGMNLKAELQNMDVSEIKLKGDPVAVNGGENMTETAGDVYYVSSDETILKVSDTGVVTAVSEGTASVRTFAVSGGRKYEGNLIEFTVSGKAEGVLPTGMELTAEKEQIAVEEKLQFKVTVLGEAGVSQEVEWSVLTPDTSAVSDLATIDEQGMLTANKAGVVEVCARAVNGMEAHRLLTITETGYELTSNFTVVNKDVEHLTIPEEGKVQITVQNGGLWATQTPHNVVVGDFGKNLENVTATVKVEGKTVKNYDEAGLIFYKDSDNYVAVQRKHGDGTPQIHVVTEQDQKPDESNKKTDVNDTAVYYKLEKKGNDITGFYSVDGKSWAKVGKVTNDRLGKDFKIGFVAGSGNKESNTSFVFSDLNVNNEIKLITQKAEAAAVKTAKLNYAKDENKLTADYTLSDDKASVMVKWAVADKKDGVYSVKEGFVENPTYATKVMKDKYVKAVIIPKNASGMVGEMKWTDPVQVTGEGIDAEMDKLPSSNASLKTAEIIGLQKGFTFESGTYFYHTTASTAEKEVQFKFAAENENAKMQIYVNGKLFEANEGTAVLTSGRNLIEVNVTAADQITTKQYRFTISRIGDNNTQLKTLTVNDTPIVLEEGRYEYTQERGDAQEVVVKAEAVSPSSRVDISCNGNVVQEGKIILKPGQNIVHILVYPETSALPCRYTLNLKVPKADNANLEALSLGENIHLNEAFAPDTLKYTALTSAETVQFSAKAEEANAKLRISLGDQVAANGTGSIEKTFHVQEGENLIRVEVVSPDEKQTKTYEIALKASGDVYLSDLDWESASSGDSENPTTKDKSCGQNTITLWNGKEEQTFAKGIGSHAKSEIVYNIADQGYQTFEAYVGVDRETKEKPDEPNIRFQVFVDDQEKFDSGEMNFDTKMKAVSVDIQNASKLKLVMDGVRNTWSGHGDWADVKLKKDFVTSRECFVTAKANDPSMGMVTMNAPDGSYKKGEKAEVKAVANEGFRFVNWTDAEGNAVSDSNPYVFAVMNDVNLTANFEKISTEKLTFSVTANNETMGTVTVEPQQDFYEAGTKIKVSAVPASEEYEFVGFTKKGTQEVLSKENPYVFQIQENMELTANFKEVEHSYLIYVETTDTQMGTVTVDPANEGNIYKEGTEITVKAEPKAGYEFVQWLEVTNMEGEEVLTPVEDAQAEFKFPAETDRVLRAEFRLALVPETYYRVVVQSNDETMGTVSMDREDGVFKEGESASVKAEANEGFEFVGWKEKGQTEYVSKVSDYQFVVTKNTELFGEFKAVEAPHVPTAREILDDILANNKIPSELEAGTEKLILPEVPEGSKIEIVVVNPEGIIALDGAVITPEKDTEVIVTIQGIDANGTIAKADVKILVKGEKADPEPNPNPDQEPTPDPNPDDGNNGNNNGGSGNGNNSGSQNGGSTSGSHSGVQTGDNANIIAWAVLLVAAVAVSVAVVIVRRKKK